MKRYNGLPLRGQAITSINEFRRKTLHACNELFESVGDKPRAADERALTANVLIALVKERQAASLLDAMESQMRRIN